MYEKHGVPTYLRGFYPALYNKEGNIIYLPFMEMINSILTYLEFIRNKSIDIVNIFSISLTEIE